MKTISSSYLTESRWLYELYMQAPVAVGIYAGESHVIEFANPKMCELWGRSLEQVMDKPLFEALPEVSKQGFEEILTNVFRTGESFSGDELPATLERKGVLRLGYFNIVYKPLRNSDNEIIGIVQLATEVTGQVIARKEAEKGQEILKEALEGGGMGTWYIDYIQGTSNYSEEFARILGYAEKYPTWSVDRFMAHVHPDDRSYAMESYARALEHGRLDYEVRILPPGGQDIRWVHIKGETSYNLKGQPISMSGILMDISEQKAKAKKERQLAVERAAREEAERQGTLLKELFMKAPALICAVKGEDFVFDLVNPLYQELFPGRELKGKAVLDALPELKDQPILDILRNVYQTGEHFVGNEVPVMLDREGRGELSECFFNFIYQPQRSTKGQIEGVLVFGFEVTDQIQARKQIESSEKSLRIALEAGNMGTWHLDLQSDTFICSKQYDLIFGYTESPTDWSYDRFMEHVLLEDRAEVENAFKTAREIVKLDFRARIRRIDGQERWVAVRGDAFYEGDMPVRMAGVIMDITEPKMVEEKLRELSLELASRNTELAKANREINSRMEELSLANHQLKLINADLDNFVYTASHDLKAPINNIEGLMSLLNHKLPADTLKNEVVQKTLNMINASVDRFKHTIAELTDIARVQKELGESSLVNLTEVVKEVEWDLQPQIEETSAVINIQVPADTNVHFSHKNLKSIIYNLLSNAIKYRAPERSPEINISCVQEEDQLVLRVEDNGLGMKPKAVDKIFSMFTRLHTHVEGSGIGLYLVKRILDNAGGKLKVESEEGKGSVFKVFFPLVRPAGQR